MIPGTSCLEGQEGETAREHPSGDLRSLGRSREEGLGRRHYGLGLRYALSTSASTVQAMSAASIPQTPTGGASCTGGAAQDQYENKVLRPLLGAECFHRGEYVRLPVDFAATLARTYGLQLSQDAWIAPDHTVFCPQPSQEPGISSTSPLYAWLVTTLCPAATSSSCKIQVHLRILVAIERSMACVVLDVEHVHHFQAPGAGLYHVPCQQYAWS